MATIINTPSSGGDHHGDDGMGVGMIFGIVVAFLVVVALFYMYGWPAIRGEQPGTTNIYNPQQPGTTNVYNPPAPSPTPAPAPGTTTTTTTY